MILVYYLKCFNYNTSQSNVSIDTSPFADFFLFVGIGITIDIVRYPWENVCFSME